MVKDVDNIYRMRIAELEKQQSAAMQKGRKLTGIRLVSFICSIVAFYILFPHSIIAAILTAAAFLAAFGIVVIADMRNQGLIDKLTNLIAINENEINAIDGDFSAFDPGTEFANPQHPYSSDLDIFGEKSIYQMICRAATKSGRERLAQRLIRPLSPAEISENKSAVEELCDQLEWRQLLQEAATQNGKSKNELQNIKRWIGSKRFINTRQKWFVKFYPIVTLIAIAATLAGYSSLSLLAALFPYFVFYGKNSSSTTKLQQITGNIDRELATYSQILALIEKQKFSSKRLIELQQNILAEKNKPSGIVAKFSALTKKLDYRNNIAFMLTVGFISFWDFRIAAELERWKEKFGGKIMQWLDVVGEIEAISSLSNLKYNNPAWTFPTISSNYFEFSAKQLGHPLIGSKNRITNNFDMKGQDVVLLTGSNMAGKSTFLRTLGVNMVLAYAGSAVCAQSMQVSYVPIRSSMRVTDSLAENTSSFYAEIKRLGEIVNAIKKGEKPFLLLDEILRGTNSNDRHIGSIALIKLLIQSKVCGIIATHDISLSEMQEHYPESIKNYNFDVQVDENDELYFDYKIKEGVCKSMNASILMRKIGLDV